MSSPPNYAASPASVSRKRPSITGSQLVPNPKRRKPSTVSNSSHPLRQTSFPPPEQAIASPSRASYSPAFEGNASVAGSTVSGGGRKQRKKRTKKGADTASAAGQNSPSTAGGPQRSVVNAEEAEGEDEDEMDVGDDTMLEGGGTMDEAELKQEKEHMAMLLSRFDDDQTNRYEVWRRIKLNKATVRKITNQTLSQSVPASIVTVINGCTKVFIGELIERARDVQTEWLASAPALPTGEPNPAFVGRTLNVRPTTTETNPKIQERDRGPLLPDHLREALRRYKKDHVGGSAGFEGLSLHGKENVMSRTGGKRLFR